jgi:hypothetical protein
LRPSASNLVVVWRFSASVRVIGAPLSSYAVVSWPVSGSVVEVVSPSWSYVHDHPLPAWSVSVATLPAAVYVYAVSSYVPVAACR